MFHIGCCLVVLTARTGFVVRGSHIGPPRSSPGGCGVQSVDAVSQSLSVLLSSSLLAPEVLQGVGLSWLVLKVVVVPGCFSVMVGPVLLAPWVGCSLRVHICRELRSRSGIGV